MKFALIITAFIAGALAAPAAVAEPEALAALENVEKRCLANGGMQCPSNHS